MDPIIMTRQTIEEYNLDLDKAIMNVEAGNFITLEELEKEMESWFREK